MQGRFLLSFVLLHSCSLAAAQSNVYPTVDIHSVPTGNREGWWEGWATCPDGTFATQFRQRVEAPCGSCDDTAMNAIKMTCSDSSEITSYEGRWGSWSANKGCPSGRYFDGYRIKSEGWNGDNTGANAVEMYCGDERVNAGNDGPWGSWSTKASCPQDYAICGFKIQFSHGSGYSDQGMSDMIVRCCHTSCLPGLTGPNGGPCLPCVAGSYKTSQGHANCTLCVAGKNSDSAAATSASTCIDCARGKYSNTAGSANESDCLMCPPHSDSLPGSFSLINCTCNQVSWHTCTCAW